MSPCSAVFKLILLLVCLDRGCWDALRVRGSVRGSTVLVAGVFVRSALRMPLKLMCVVFMHAAQVAHQSGSGVVASRVGDSEAVWWAITCGRISQCWIR